MSTTTVYDVVTRYHAEDAGASRKTREYGDAARYTTQHLNGASAAAMNLGRTAATAIGAMAGIASVGFAIERGLTMTFRSLNAELDSTIRLGAQVNAFFEFDKDPGANFAMSLSSSRQLIGNLASDAAKLPGQLSEYVSIASQIAGSVFAGGGDLETVRRMATESRIVAPFAGQGGDEAGRQVMSILLGQAGVDRPMWSFLSGSGFIDPKYADAKTFNEASPAERLRVLDEAMGKLANNEIFRKELIGTFDTQLGTLADTVFGINGLLAEGGGRSLFEWLLGELTSLNQTLDENRPTIVEGMVTLTGQIRAWADALSYLASAAVPDWLFSGSAQSWAMAEREKMLNNSDYAQAMVKEFADQLAPEWGLKEASRAIAPPNMHVYGDIWDRVSKTAAENRHKREYYYTYPDPSLVGPQLPPGVRDPARKNGATAGAATTKNVVHQTVYIQVDLQSDDSPEAIAVKIGKAAEIAAKRPTSSSRGASLIPMPRSMR